MGASNWPRLIEQQEVAKLPRSGSPGPVGALGVCPTELLHCPPQGGGIHLWARRSCQRAWEGVNSPEGASLGRVEKGRGVYAFGAPNTLASCVSSCPPAL